MSDETVCNYDEGFISGNYGCKEKQIENLFCMGRNWKFVLHEEKSAVIWETTESVSHI